MVINKKIQLKKIQLNILGLWQNADEYIGQLVY